MGMVCSEYEGGTTMIAIRVFRDQGINEFKKYILGVKNNSNTPVPNLNDEPYSYKFTPTVNIDENKFFSTRMDIAKYLSKQFSSAGVQPRDVIGAGKEGLWTWLAYIFFSQITDNRRKILRLERYICSSDWNRYYVHLIAGAYYLFTFLGEELSKLFLCSSPYILNDFNDHMACYQYIVGYQNIVEVAHILYWDEQRNAPKKGAQSIKNPGNIRRFAKVISQLELTYDVYTMTPQEILKILPKEFDKWKK